MTPSSVPEDVTQGEAEPRSLLGRYPELVPKRGLGIKCCEALASVPSNRLVCCWG